MAMSTENVLNTLKETAAANTAQSQAFAREQMRFNAEQAAIDREWQEKMSNTAHQREVKDLIAAGLNPILSTGGSGASTPSGASAVGASGQVDTSYASALAGFASTLVSSAAQIEMARLSAAATLGSAATSASASRFSSVMSAWSSQYIAKNYPNTLWGYISAATGGTDNLFGSLFKFLLSPFTGGSRGSAADRNQHT